MRRVYGYADTLCAIGQVKLNREHFDQAWHVCTGTPVHCEQTVRLSWKIERMAKPARRMRRVSTITLVHISQTLILR
jgi:hypothetical protein